MSCPGLKFEISEDPWLSAVLGNPAFKIEVQSASPDIAEAISQHARRFSHITYYAKVEAGNVEAVRELCLAGMYVVDVNVTFGLDLTRTAALQADSSQSSIRIGRIEPRQDEDILRIASSSFVFTRFHQDPLISQAIANQIKREWIRSYIEGRRGEQLLVARIGDEPVGFLAVLANQQEGDRTRTIDLIAVDRSFQQRGVGEAMVRFLIDNSRGEYQRLHVGTQVANVPSIRMYEKLGFLLSRAQYVLHMHKFPSPKEYKA